MSTPPTFAVVGHPNKGKSSIVATLARDDSVGIAPEPGTTTHARKYPMRVDDEVLYVLVDTPGFQRARRALQWMRDHETTAAKHPHVVAEFVREHKGTGQFTDEVELLGPIVEGAGILYVVDGSKPYGEEYEAEMEVLRWTGRPSMALINPIGDASHADEWAAALGQYFRIVRVFNAVTAEFDKRVELLHAFAQMDDAWREPLRRAAEALRADRAARMRRAARLTAQMLADLVTLVVSKKLAADEEPAKHREALEADYRDRLRRIERDARDRVQEVYEHFTLQRREGDLPPDALVESDLFSERSWRVFGLSKRDFIAMGAAGGATLGVAFDVAAGGFTLGAATILGGAGGVVGGVLGWLSAQRLSQVRVTNIPGTFGALGHKELRCGPAKNPNLPFVALGRARLHHRLVAGRTHAQRGELVIDGDASPLTLTDSQRRDLQKQFNRLRKESRKRDIVADAVDELADVVEDLLRADDAP